MDQFLHGFYNLFLADRDIFAQRVIGTAIGNGLTKFLIYIPPFVVNNYPSLII